MTSGWLDGRRRGHWRLVALVAMMLEAVPAVAQTPPADGAADAAAAGSEIGGARSALLTRLLNGERIVQLDQAAFPPDVVDPMRLDEAVAFALRNNFEVLASAEKTDASKWEVVGAYGAYLPTVVYTRSSGTERSAPAAFLDANGNRVEANTHHRRDKELSVSQPLINLSLISDILLRHKALDAAHAEALATRERVAMQAIGSFYKIIQARLSVRFAQDYKSQLDRLSTQLGDRVAGGGAAPADLDRIRARSVAAQSAMIESRSEMDAAMSEFRRVTGVTPLKFQIPATLVPAPPPSLQDALQTAMQANPDYQLSLRQIDVQEQESHKAYSRLLPRLNFEYTQSRSWNADGSALGSPSSGGDVIYPYQNERRAMVVATWSLNGGTDLAQGIAAGAKAREANYRSMDTRARLEEAIRVSFNALAAARSRVPILEQAIESNAKVADAFEEQYRNASRPLFDLLDAYERYYRARLDLVQVMIAEARAGNQLRQQMGELVQALLESEPRASGSELQVKPDGRRR